MISLRRERRYPNVSGGIWRETASTDTSTLCLIANEIYLELFEPT